MLRAILQDIARNQDARDYWYLAVIVVMSAVNRPEDVGCIYSILQDQVGSMTTLSNEEKNQLLGSIVLRLREAILKGYIATGFPKAINALQCLASVTPDTIKALLPTQPIRKEQTWSDIQGQRDRGRQLFSNVYNRHTERVIKNMHSFHPDLAQTALNQLYGPTLGEVAILDARETSIVVCSGLMIENVRPQLIGHYHGAFNNGASKQDMERLVTIVSALADYYKTPMAKL